MSMGLEMEDKEEVLLGIAVALVSGARRQQMIDAVLDRGTFAAVAERVSVTQKQRSCEIAQECGELGISIVPLSSPRYVDCLRRTSSPPPVLFVRAQKKLKEVLGPCISVVGTRSASIDVCEVASHIARDLAFAGFTVVSGLALGIDGAAHRGALAANAPVPTVAVLAHGLDTLYPRSHTSLAQDIINRGGLLISEYPPGTQPLKHHFLARNRIIAGLSRGVVVVQAGARSGSLVTAQFAADYGRDVFIFVNGQDDDRSQGGNAMLDDGAIPIVSARDVLREYNTLGQAGKEDSAAFEWLIFPVDDFLERHKFSFAELLRLEIEGKVIQMPGNRIKVNRVLNDSI